MRKLSLNLDLSTVKESEIAQFRRDNLGFVFQEFNLLDTFSLKDNIFLPLVTAGIHMAFALPMLSKVLRVMYLGNNTLLVMTALGIFTVFSVFYAIVYKITSHSYYSIVTPD